MTNPYRTRPDEPRARPPEARLRLPTFAFGFMCVVMGTALSGKDRAMSALVGTLTGGVLILTGSRRLDAR